MYVGFVFKLPLIIICIGTSVISKYFVVFGAKVTTYLLLDKSLLLLLLLLKGFSNIFTRLLLTLVQEISEHVRIVQLKNIFKIYIILTMF